MASTNPDPAPTTTLPGLTTPSQPISTSNDAPTPLPPPPASSTTTPTSPSPPPKTILLINGPNLNLLGHREPHIYGHTTLADIERHLHTTASTRNVRVLTFQSNHEGAIVDRIHDAFWANLTAKKGASTINTNTNTTNTNGTIPTSTSTSTPQTTQHPSPSPSLLPSSTNPPSNPPSTVDAIIINPGAYTHTSIAIRDALSGASIPFIECHISNVHAREEFRHKSFLSDKAEAVVAGLGVFGYVAALEYWCWKWGGGGLEGAR